jgi:hypothetical protein
MKRSGPQTVLFVDVCPRSQQQAHHLRMTLYSTNSSVYTSAALPEYLFRRWNTTIKIVFDPIPKLSQGSTPVRLSIGKWCNGTTAGLGYLEVLELSLQILLLGRLASVSNVSSQWGRRIQFLY